MNKIACVLAWFSAVGFATTLPLVFEPNRGQADSRVQYLARGPKATLWLTGDEAVLGIGRDALRVRFEGGNPKPVVQAEEALPGKANYFIDKDASRWRHDIPLYGKVRYQDVYPGVDVVFYGNPGDLEYDLVLAPGADPRKIRLAYSGAKKMRVDAGGDLVFSIGTSEIRQHRPKVFQGTRAIEARYQLRGRNRVGLSIADYDRSRALTIDPIITYSTYLAGSISELAQAVAMDAQGNVYVTGQTSSPNYPIVGGINAPETNNSTPIPFIAKINPSASGAASVVWSTVLGGGSLGTFSLGVAVDTNGDVYAGGFTFSSFDFVTTQKAFQTSANCMTNINGANSNCLSGWVAKISPGGNQLIYSTFLSGGRLDSVFGIAADASGNAYVAGITGSLHFPTRGLPTFQPALNGSQNGFVAKLSADGSSLLSSTLFGGEGTEFLEGMALDANGIVYVGGNTTSTHLPVTQNAYQSSLGGAHTAGFLAAFDLTQGGPSVLVYSTYLGGPSPGGNSGVNAIAVDSTGTFYATGYTTDANFPVTSGAFQSKFGGAILTDTGNVTGDAFVVKLSPSAQGSAQLKYSSFFGGVGNEDAAAIAIDSAGRMVIGGTTGSSNLPVTADAYECCFANPGNLASKSTGGFVARIDPSKSGPSGLLYATYIGGSPGAFGNIGGVAMNSAGTVAAVAGWITASNFPVTAGAFEKKVPSNSDGGYLATFNFATSGPLVTTAANAASFQSAGFSPGLIFTLIGTALGPVAPFGPQLDATGKVSTLVDGTQVLVDGVPAPLLYGSATQINAVAPYELAAKVGQTVFAQVVSNGVAGNVMPVTVVATAPAIFYNAGGQGAILNQDSSVNGANNPAAKGSYISIYCTGEGQTTSAGVDGAIANEPVAQLPHPVASVSVTIGGIAVPATDIYYAGAAPQSVAGLLQVTVKVPANAASGNIPVVVTVGGQGSQSGVTVAVQ
jgi:uncharacterized protein (TIGR03437 family)